MVVEYRHVACVCVDWMKIPIFKKTIIIFWRLQFGIFLKLGKKSPEFHWELGWFSAPENTKINPWCVFAIAWNFWKRCFKKLWWHKKHPLTEGYDIPYGMAQVLWHQHMIWSFIEDWISPLTEGYDIPYGMAQVLWHQHMIWCFIEDWISPLTEAYNIPYGMAKVLRHQHMIWSFIEDWISPLSEGYDIPYTMAQVLWHQHMIWSFIEDWIFPLSEGYDIPYGMVWVLWHHHMIWSLQRTGYLHLQRAMTYLMEWSECSDTSVWFEVFVNNFWDHQPWSCDVICGNRLWSRWYLDLTIIYGKTKIIQDFFQQYWPKLGKNDPLNIKIGRN